MIRRITPEEEYTAGLALYRAGGVHPMDEEGGMWQKLTKYCPIKTKRLVMTSSATQA